MDEKQPSLRLKDMVSRKVNNSLEGKWMGQVNIETIFDEAVKCCTEEYIALEGSN